MISTCFSPSRTSDVNAVGDLRRCHQPANDLSGRTVLFLHAHPDDEAIFTAVTMRRLADRGVRVVLVTATGGELGVPLVPLAPGESMRARRIAELESAAAALGVARLVLLGHRDSGLDDEDSLEHPNAFARGSVRGLAQRLADLVLAECAEAVVHYDDEGIYGHPDHVAVHKVGDAAAWLAGVASYETTVDRDSLDGSGGHVLDLAAPSRRYGREATDITVSLAATDSELAAKRAAMAAHASQIAPAAVASASFARAYGTEWYLNRGSTGILEELTGKAIAGAA